MKAVRASGRILIGIVLSTIMMSYPSPAGSGDTYHFLRSEVGARASALGGSFVSVTDDPEVIFYNPAGLAVSSRQAFSFGYFKHLLDINSFHAGYSDKVEGLGAIGFGAVYINYGEFKKTGEEGQDLGTFGAGELSLNAAYGGELTPALRYGLGLKFIYSSIESYSSSAYAVDMGAQYDVVPDRFSVGASLLHLGTQIDPYGATAEGLPLDMKVGMSLTPEHLPALLMLDFHHLTDNQEDFIDRFEAFSAGAEFTVSPNVFLRAGYNNDQRQALQIGQSSGLAGFSVGLGVATGNYQFDYAFTSNGPVGAFHRISLAF